MRLPEVFLVTTWALGTVLGSPVPQLVYQADNATQMAMLQELSSKVILDSLSPNIHLGDIKYWSVPGSFVKTGNRIPFVSPDNTSLASNHTSLMNNHTSLMNKHISLTNKLISSAASVGRVSLGKRDEGKEIKYDYCDGGETCITLVNGTPYRWRKGYKHSYQVRNWGTWPEYIEPGETFSLSPKYSGHGMFNRKADMAAEVVYHLEGTKKPLSFMTELRKGKSPYNGTEGLFIQKRHNTWIRFLEDLETKNLPKETEMDLGFHKHPDGERFVLAGKEGDFVANGGPEAWMQSMMDDLGDVPLSEIILGRSHHGGSYINNPVGFGTPSNTRTQMEDLYTQLRDGGIRVVDVRTMLWYEDEYKWAFHEAHGSKVGKDWYGAIGASFHDMLDAINRFNDDYPGELIIFDIAGDAWERYGDIDRMEGKGRAMLYELLKSGLKHRIDLPATDDFTELPLEDFIGDGKSGVIVRISQKWVNADDGEYPGPEEGFVTSSDFPITSVWSNTNDDDTLLEEQSEELLEHRGGETPLERQPRRLHNLQWLLTLQGLENIHPVKNIIGESRGGLWTKLFTDLWRVMTVDAYPSWLTIDAIEGTEFKALTMAMNKCFVARGCGDWAEEARALD